MKTLILNGSPRKKGDSKYIMDQIVSKLHGEVHIINVYEENYSACIDCRYCWEVCDCRIKDDMFKAYELLNEVDNIILSSPVYFSELSGPLLSYVSRFQRYYAERFLMKNHEFIMKPKKGALILSAGGDIRGIKRPIETTEIIFRQIKTKLLGVVSTDHTNEVPVEKDTALESQILNIVEVLNS